MPESILPASLLAGGALLIGFVCWAALVRRWWANTSPWRFEYFAMDEALGFLFGAALLALIDSISASETGVAGHLLLSSNTALAELAFAGFAAAVGVLTLAGAARLLAPRLAWLSTVALAVLLDDVLAIRNWESILAVLLLAWLLFVIVRDTRAQDPSAVPVRPAARQKPEPRRTRPSTKGMLLVLTSGVFFAIATPIARSGVAGELGSGAFAGVLIVAALMLLLVGFFAFILLHAEIDQPPGRFGRYFGKQGSHRVGVAAGAVGAAAVTGLFSQFEAPQNAGYFWIVAPVLVALILPRHSGGSRRASTLLLLLFSAGLALSFVPIPSPVQPIQ